MKRLNDKVNPPFHLRTVQEIHIDAIIIIMAVKTTVFY